MVLEPNEDDDDDDDERHHGLKSWDEHDTKRWMMMRERMTSVPLVCVCVNSANAHAGSEHSNSTSQSEGSKLLQASRSVLVGSSGSGEREREPNFGSRFFHSLYHSPDILHKPHRKVFLLDMDVIVP